MKSILFVTGTRADFGKIYPLIEAIRDENKFEVRTFVTGMHMLQEYGHTYHEVLRKFEGENFLFINQRFGDDMDVIFAKTVQGFSDYIRERKPDLVVIHGDRIEAMATAIVAMLNGCRLAHIEGGEISGTVDESMRHAISKISNIHYVSNEESANRLRQMGENPAFIFNIGSPEVDVMSRNDLPTIEEVKRRYSIDFESYSICILHPVTTEQEFSFEHSTALVEALIISKKKYLVILPNNDSGSASILRAYEKIRNHKNFRVLPSMRFEYYLCALKNADFIIGNSSSGVREAPYFGVPSINLGTRQRGRSNAPTIVDSDFSPINIQKSIRTLEELDRIETSFFGNGNSGPNFAKSLLSETVWSHPIQKEFIDFYTDR